MIAAPVLSFFLLIAFPSWTSAGLFSTPSEEQAAELYESGEYEAALEKFLEAEIDNPGRKNTKYNQGNSYYQLDRNLDAEKKYRDALGDGIQDEIDSDVLYNLGKTLYREGRLGQAAEMFRKVLEMDPEEEDARHNLELVRKRIALSRETTKQEQQGDRDENGEDTGESGEPGDSIADNGEKTGKPGDSDGGDSGQGADRQDDHGEMEKSGSQEGERSGSQDDEPQNAVKEGEGDDDSSAGIPPEGEISALNEGGGDDPSQTATAGIAEPDRQDENSMVNLNEIKRLLGSVREGKIIRPQGRRRTESKKDW